MPCNRRLYIIANYIANYHTNRCSRRIGHEISHYFLYDCTQLFSTYWSMGCSLIIPQYRSKKPFFLSKRTANTIHTNGLDYTIEITPLLARAWHYYLRGLNYWLFSCKPLRFYSLATCSEVWPEQEELQIPIVGDSVLILNCGTCVGDVTFAVSGHTFEAVLNQATLKSVEVQFPRQFPILLSEPVRVLASPALIILIAIIIKYPTWDPLSR